MLADLRAAFAFLTVLPLPYPEDREPGAAFAYFPLVGLLIGGMLWGLAWVPWPSPEVRAFGLLLAWVVITGGLHLDGFGDSCDGLLATTSPVRRLEILKDTHTGSWAVVGLILLLLGKWSALREVSAPLLLAPPILARWAMVVAALWYPHARSSGLGTYFRQGLGRRQGWLASLFTLICLGALAWLVDWRIVGLVLIPLFCVTGFARWAAGRLGGGLTGDVYGAICEITELGCLLVMVFL